MSASIGVFSAYVPNLVLAQLGEGPASPGASGVERFEAAVLFADISGFTTLTERLAVLGSAGTEQLSVALNAYFGRLIGLIAEYGGDVVKMAGDALIAAWRATADDPLGASTARASLCGLALQAASRDHTAAQGVKLTCKVGIAAGPVALLLVGGERNRREWLLSGAPLVRMGEAEHRARPGEVVLTPEAWDLIADGGAVGEMVGSGFVRLAHASPMGPRPARLVEAGPDLMPVLRYFVPGAIRSRLDAGQDGWLAELRRLSVLFVQVPQLDLDAEGGEALAIEIFRVVQERLYRLEGSLNKLNVDEKGPTLLAAFGLPPLAHKDDASRALRAAREIREGLRSIGVACSIGVATGRAYCGEIGHASRREYTIIGRVVNLAARLMLAAEAEAQGREILCDAETVHAARDAFQFEALPPRPLKHFEGDVPVFRPSGEVAPGPAPRSTIGRAVERSRLLGRLEALRGGRKGVVLIEGEPGIGKTRLVADLAGRAGALGVTTLIGSGDSIERSTPYHAWRAVFAMLLGEPVAARSDIEARLGDDSEALALAPLLGAVLPLDWPENERTAAMAGPSRLDSTNDLLLRLLRRASAAGPLLLVIDDAQWMDSASWALALRVARGLDGALMVVASRASAPAFEDEHHALAEVADDVLRLGNLPSEDTLALARDRLGVDRLPPEAEELILVRAQGNPLYCEELAYALRDAGLLHFEGSQCRLAEGVDLASVGIPEGVEGIINDRVDRLPPAQQMALKVASVIGRLFSLRLLQDIYPIEPDRPAVPGHLAGLSRLELILPEEPEPDLAYIFRHVITRDVVYDLLPFAQRSRLHHDVARWYEASTPRDLLPALDPLLAHHWELAGEDARAIDHLEKAGERALLAGADREAAGFLERAIDLQAKSPPEAARPGRVARWHSLLGEAYLHLGHLAKSRDHAAKALAGLGWPIPTPARLPAAYLPQLGLQAARLLRRSGEAGPSPGGAEAVAARRLGSTAYGLVGQLCYFNQDRAFGVYAALRSLNLAGRDGPSPELARALAVMCIAAGLVPAHRLAEGYRDRAFRVVDRVDDRAGRAWVLQLTGMYDLGVGRWNAARASLGESVAIHRSLGDWRRWEESSGELARLDYDLGRYAESGRRFLEFGDEAARRGHDQATAWGLHGRAKALVRLGRLDEALGLLGRSLALPPEAVGGGDAILRGGLLAQIHALRREWGPALRRAEETSGLARRSPPMVSYSLEGYAGAADAYLALWEAGQADPRRAWRAIASLFRIARVYPVGLSRAWTCLGRARRLAGRDRRARWAFGRAVQAAERLGLPCELATARLELGRSLAEGDPAREALIEQARASFARLGIAPVGTQETEAVVP